MVLWMFWIEEGLCAHAQYSDGGGRSNTSVTPPPPVVLCPGTVLLLSNEDKVLAC